MSRQLGTQTGALGELRYMRLGLCVSSTGIGPAMEISAPRVLRLAEVRTGLAGCARGSGGEAGAALV